MSDRATCRRGRRCSISLRLGDNIVPQISRAAPPLLVLVILGGVIVALIVGSMPALRAFGLDFLIDESWNPVTERFGAIAPIYGTIVTSLIAMVIAVPVGLMIAMFLTELCPMWLRRPIGIAIELLAGIPSIIYGIWGLFVFAPFLQQYVQPVLIALFGNVPVLSSLFAGPPYGIGMLTAGLILAIMVLPFITSISRDVFEAVPPVLKEVGLRPRLHHLGSVPQRRAALHARRRDRRRDARARPRARRDHGGDLRDRQRAQDLGLDPGARHHHLGHHRQRVHRGGRRHLHLLADRARPDPVRHHVHRARDRALPAAAARSGRMRAERHESRSLRRAPPPQRDRHGALARRDRCSGSAGWC